MFKPFTVLDLYKHVQPSGKLFPVSTSFEWWDDVYTSKSAVYDREFARRFANFIYFDFLKAEAVAGSVADFKADVLSILTLNQKKYAEMYRAFVVSDQDDPLTYNYDMTETTGAQHSETKYGATSATKGQESYTKGSETITKGEQQNTDGAVTNTHSVAPFNSVSPQAESSDAKTAQTYTEGQRQDINGQRQDTYGSRTDTTLEHTDEMDSDEWTLTRRGNIGVQTAGDMLRIHTDYWTNHFKFMEMIFEDICKQLLLVGN